MAKSITAEQTAQIRTSTANMWTAIAAARPELADAATVMANAISTGGDIVAANRAISEVATANRIPGANSWYNSPAYTAAREITRETRILLDGGACFHNTLSRLATKTAAVVAAVTA